MHSPLNVCPEFAFYFKASPHPIFTINNHAYKIEDNISINYVTQN